MVIMFVYKTQRPNCLVSCTMHPPPEIAHKLRQRHMAVYGPQMMYQTPRGYVPCVFFQQVCVVMIVWIRF